MNHNLNALSGFDLSVIFPITTRSLTSVGAAAAMASSIDTNGDGGYSCESVCVDSDTDEKRHSRATWKARDSSSQYFREQKNKRAGYAEVRGQEDYEPLSNPLCK